jgi:catechol 2,3-dioxygenase-like lactoylglutathione lyase family enzyme
MIDHLGVPVNDYEKSKAFYLAALKPLGIGLVMEAGEGRERAAGLGTEGKPFFWFAQEKVGERIHLAFTAKSRAEVDAFHAAALAAGATDNGSPGLRPEYHPNYYGAFVIDLNGINLEAVCHAPG